MTDRSPSRSSQPLQVASLSFGLAGAALGLLVFAAFNEGLRGFAPWVASLVLVSLGALIAVDSARRIVRAGEVQARPLGFAALCGAAVIAVATAVGIAVVYVRLRG